MAADAPPVRRVLRRVRPPCFPDGELTTGDQDVFLGELDIGLGRPVPVWISRPQFEYWRYTHLTIDVVPGRGAGFSLEAPEGVRFVIRSRMLSEDELAVLEA